MADLWPHQRQGVEQLVRHRAWGLFWEPGCGKTPVLVEAGRRVGGRQLWVVPAALRTQVAREVERFRGDHPSIQIITSGSDTVGDATVVIVSYDLARNLRIWKQLFAIEWSSLVLDEAHKLNSTGAVQTHAIYGAQVRSKGALVKAATYVWIATGTPVTNHADGLYSHFSRLWPHLWQGTKAEWVDRFCELERDLYGERIVGSKNKDELNRLLRKAGSRLRLRDVRDMPPLVVDTLPLEAEALDLSDFDAPTMQLLREALDEMDADDRGWSLERAESLAPALATLRRRIALAKADHVAALAADEILGGTDRVLVFGCHVEALQRVAAKTKGGLIIGSTKPVERDNQVDRFLAGELPILAGNVQSMGTGLNLQKAARVIFLDASWSPALNEQAIGRAFRAGQDRPVRVSFVSLAGSVDERVAAALARKASAIRRIVDTEI